MISWVMIGLDSVGFESSHFGSCYVVGVKPVCIVLGFGYR
jgi:hypothetical protein